MISADQILAHLVGDYVLQSDWMASQKTKRLTVAIVHAIAYSLPFLALRPSLAAWLMIVGTHAIIDRWRLARYVVWTKEWLAPTRPPPLAECPTGYPADKPVWLATWLLILADNTLHLALNSIALRYL
jgi:DNA-directed RNA polymerase specialized sigma24 family protein